ncbi:quinone oxidoreductase family protein [Streptantibioticus ferralitis]|uniref:Zinc-binding alcohol dehydrogenase family protein n=1 Tax=Streptantibioticus ferralitis TaxID=236510 RepID=A0ABT5ZBT7_9ACTN|nr:zinc-binding alcohol dehydrogenase family protein [Streptantibioticus ferralitis]MDF2261289.1 zinc-binding alcohol dehydrogenase family protein [Streptantibioticus ferralitis]
MRAAVVTAFGQPPRYQQYPDPRPAEGEVLVRVLAAGLHPRVRSGAAGTHYTSDQTLPLVPGFDGVGRTPENTRVFFGGLKAPNGSMAEYIAIPADQLVPLPDGVDDIMVAAAMNPAVSAWLALTHRAELKPGEHVLILGATGNAGQMAIQLARLLGAGTITAAGRNAQALAKLPALGADHAVSLDTDDDTVARRLAQAAANADVVVDYLWGHPTEVALAALTSARTDAAHRLRWVHVGAMAGPTIALPGATLRKADVDFRGSGQGSVSPAGMRAAHRDLADRLPTAGLTIDTLTMPLRDVESAWTANTPTGTRIVLVP